MVAKRKSDKKKSKKKNQRKKAQVRKALFEEELAAALEEVEGVAPSTGAAEVEEAKVAPSSPLLKVASSPPSTPLQGPDFSDEDGDDDFKLQLQLFNGFKEFVPATKASWAVTS